MLFYKQISRTSAVSSKNFRSILIFASCVVGTCNIQYRRVFIWRFVCLVHYNGKCWYFYFEWGIVVIVIVVVILLLLLLYCYCYC